MKKLFLFIAALMLCGQQMFADEPSTLTVLSSDSTMGIGYGSGIWNARLPWTDIYAIPQEGYYFAGWDDGNMDNPRHICVDEYRKVVTAIFAESQAADLGDMGTPCTGCTAIRVTDGTTTVTLYNATGVDYIKVPTRNKD